MFAAGLRRSTRPCPLARMTPATEGRPMDRPPWIEVLRQGRALPTIVLSLAIGLHAVDVFVISTVMPAVVAEIGGAGFYAWATMIYIVAPIIRAPRAPPPRARLGPPRGHVLGRLPFPARSAGCGVSPPL